MAWPEHFTHFKSPILQWQEMPTFLVCEYLFFLLAAVSFLHAHRNGPLHRLIWWASLLAGTANDLFFMALPVVDNFWQAQATIMLTPRLPLYIPCVYICFMYYSVAAAWHLSLKAIQTAVLAGGLALLFYGPYDILGAKFLWWTWHATDAPIRERLLGVPIGSSMWILTFVSSFSFLLQLCTKKDPNVTFKRSLVCLGLCCAFTTPLMLIQMTLLGFLDKEQIPSLSSFVGLLIMYAFLFTVPFFYSSNTNEGPKMRNSLNRLAAGSLVFYYVVLFSITLLGIPEKHVSVGIHQMFGPCDVTGIDITGRSRRIYLCKEDTDLSFRMDCGSLPSAYENWFTVCGKPYQPFIYWFLGMSFYCVFGSISYVFLFMRSDSHPKLRTA